MKKLATLSAVAGGLLFVSVCVGLMTGGPALAQGGRPAADVRVVNTAAEAIPVNVNTLPAVQVGNGNANPVPVNVTNLPAVQSPEPFEMRVQVGINGENRFAIVDAYTVPEGKLLVLEYVNFICNSNNEPEPRHDIEIRNPTTLASLHFLPKRNHDNADYGGEEILHYTAAGETVRVVVTRTFDFDNPNRTDFTYVILSGQLVNAQ
jgi:hypothetical protein